MMRSPQIRAFALPFFDFNGAAPNGQCPRIGVGAPHFEPVQNPDGSYTVQPEGGMDPYGPNALTEETIERIERAGCIGMDFKLH